eukprot:scaffold541_cov335-Pavlova_lutheri.AAC.8
MDEIVATVVAHVSEQHPRKPRFGQCRGCGWEDQPESVVWRFMMTSVQEEVHGDAPVGCGCCVKEAPVDEVFHRSPCHHPDGKERSEPLWMGIIHQ